MKKTFRLTNLDCANCAQKMQTAIEKLSGVEQITINFMSQKLTLAASDERFDEVLAQAAQLIKKIEPGCAIDTVV